MKNAVLPAVVAVLLIAVVTVVEGVYLKDRWGEPGAAAADLGKRFAQVPKKIGDWVGIDQPVDKEVQERSGAVNFVNRRYTHEPTNRVVDLWLIIGHARDIIRHTPDICYASSGFRAQGNILRHTVNYGDGQEANFYTSKFQKEDALVRQTQRVYWAWNHPEELQWKAPESPRYHYGMVASALYKMYFTSAVASDEKTIDDNPAAEFVQLVLPVIDAALFSEEGVESLSEPDAAPATLPEETDGLVEDSPTAEASVLVEEQP